MEHTISKMCEVLGVSTSGYYAYLNRLDQGETEKEAFDRHLEERIMFHFHDNLGTYGSPRIWRKLLKEGIHVSSKKVANHMRVLNLYAIPPRKYVQTTDSNHTKPIYKNHLDQKFEPKKPNQSWVTDITYVHTGEGFLYLNPVMDLYSRKIISYRMDDHMGQKLSLNALEEALMLRKPQNGWIHHSDRGSQYTSNAYIEALDAAGATISMSRKANPYDNACMESFFASLKKEYLYKHAFATKYEAMLAIQFYIKFYNEKRIHSSLGYISPIEKEMIYELDQQTKLKKRPKTSASGNKHSIDSFLDAEGSK